MALSIWNAFLALLMFCGGTVLLVLMYMLLAWYASLHANSTERPRNNNNKGGHGLSKSDIQKLPTVVCTSNGDTHHREKDEKEKGEEKRSNYNLCSISEDLECTVCLEEFKDGERCLLMPTCKHCFHLECAGAWLSRQPICPLCRTTALPRDEEQGPASTVVDIPE